MDSIFDFLNFIFYPWIHFFPYWWEQIINASSILGTIFLVFAMLFSFFILSSVTIICLVIIPPFFWFLSLFVLAIIQKVFKFKFPLIGDYIARNDEEANKSADRFLMQQERTAQRKIACILRNRAMTKDEYIVSANLFNFKKPDKEDIVSMISLAENVWKDTNETDRKFLEEEYEKGELDSWLKNLIYKAWSILTSKFK